MGVATDAERFWPKVDKAGPVPEFAPHLGPCWLWTAARNRDGYGRFRVTGFVTYAHVYAFTMTGGVIPEGYQIDHLCRVRACVNPAHLEAVTPAENVQRANPMGHGLAGYQRGCRCDECRRGKREQVARQRSARRERLAAGAEVEHGTRATYTNWGCRCDPCRAAHRSTPRTTSHP